MTGKEADSNLLEVARNLYWCWGAVKLENKAAFPAQDANYNYETLSRSCSTFVRVFITGRDGDSGVSCRNWLNALKSFMTTKIKCVDLQSSQLPG